MKNQFKLLALALVAATSFSVNAANTATATLNATVQVNGQCSFSSSNYSVSATGNVGTIPEANTTITYNCAAGFTPTLSSSSQQTTDSEGNTIVSSLASDSSFNNVIDGTDTLALVADGTDTTIPLHVRFAKLGGGGIPKPGTYLFAIPLTINY